MTAEAWRSVSVYLVAFSGAMTRPWVPLRICPHGEPRFSQRTGNVMLLWASVLMLAASLAGLLMLGPTAIVGELTAVAFAVSLFIVICAMKARDD